MSRIRVAVPIVFCVALLLAPTLVRAEAPQQFKWITNYDAATSQARKENKIILAYFSGSDWDPWTDKLQKEVLSTDLFKNWAKEHVVPFQIDFPKEKRVSSITKAQNNQLKTKYSVSNVPLFIFLDATGAPMTRFGYNDLKLRDDEVKGQPKAAIEFLDTALKNRPKDEVLRTFPNFTEAKAFARKNYSCLLIAVTQGHARYWIDQRDNLFKDQQFVRYVNHNVPFISMDWPDDTDNSQSAKDFRDFAVAHKVAPAPFQLLLWDTPPQYDKVKARYRSFSLQHVDQLVNQIALQLPHIDYTGNWITDYHQAQTISAQTGRAIFIAFTSMDTGDYSKKMDEEIFKSEQFLAYAHKNLVLLQLDFPSTTTQPEQLSNQNKMLADLFNIPGFPMVVVLNQKGEKLLESKYMKGGADFFMKQMVPVITRDSERLAALKEQD